MGIVLLIHLDKYAMPSPFHLCISMKTWHPRGAPGTPTLATSSLGPGTSPSGFSTAPRRRMGS